MGSKVNFVMKENENRGILYIYAYTFEGEYEKYLMIVYPPESPLQYIGHETIVCCQMNK